MTNTSLQHMYKWLLTSQLRLLREVKSWLLGITWELVSWVLFFLGGGRVFNEFVTILLLFYLFSLARRHVGS